MSLFTRRSDPWLNSWRTESLSGAVPGTGRSSPNGHYHLLSIDKSCSLMDPTLKAEILETVSFDQEGLVPVIVQSSDDGTVLMLAYMNRTTLDQTLRTGLMTYWSRSRNAVWVKGETSGNFQHVRAVHVDCDGDALLFEVKQMGDGACHTGNRSCFFRSWEMDDYVPPPTSAPRDP